MSDIKFCGRIFDVGSYYEEIYIKCSKVATHLRLGKEPLPLCAGCAKDFEAQSFTCRPIND